jgi:hypothetical protein
MVRTQRKGPRKMPLRVALVLCCWLTVSNAEASAGDFWSRLCASVDRLCTNVLGRKRAFHAFYSTHFGYYPGVWRTWPEDWEQWRQSYGMMQTSDGRPSLSEVLPVDDSTGRSGEASRDEEVTTLPTSHPTAR